MALRTIESPGVQINEVDLSLRTSFPVGTGIYITGFASKGPTDEPLEVTSFSEFEQIYGKPTNAAERYFYYTVKQVFNSPARVLVNRLPYGDGSGYGFNDSTYGALVFPVSGYDAQTNTIVNDLDSINITTYVFGAPVHIQLTSEQYHQLLTGEVLSWSQNATGSSDITGFADLGRAGIIILNKSQTTINNNFEGYYVGIIDNSNINPASNFDSILSVKSIVNNSNYTLPVDLVTVPHSSRLNFNLSATSTGTPNSISEIMESLAPFDLNTRLYDDVISIGLFKLRKSIYAVDTIKLDYVLMEQIVGSLDAHREINDPKGGPAINFFIENRAKSSLNLKILVNPYISKKNTQTWLDDDGMPKYKARILNSALLVPLPLETSTQFTNRTGLSASLSAVGADPFAGLVAADGAGSQNAGHLFPVGTYESQAASSKVIGNVPNKLQRALDKIENDELFNINITVEAGLGTIFAGKEANSTDYFDDTLFVDIGSLQTSGETVSSSVRDDYLAVVNEFITFAEQRRKDHIFIADPLRYIFVQGENTKTLEDPTKNFSVHIFSALRNLLSPLNTSYATVYGNWAKVSDATVGGQVWIPFSGFAAAVMANTDATYQPWWAPAGFTRGRVLGANDLAITPKQKQRDQLYRISVNPVAFFTNDGYVIFGQKTLLKSPSAFDRINVRRLFLYVEKAAARTAKYFVFEPNTLYTRGQVTAVLNPIMEKAKNTQGIYDYRVVCNESNNPPEVIDNNELVVDIYIQPVRTAEFVLINFYATRTGVNFDEIIGNF